MIIFHSRHSFRSVCLANYIWHRIGSHNTYVFISLIPGLSPEQEKWVRKNRGKNLVTFVMSLNVCFYGFFVRPTSFTLCTSVQLCVATKPIYWKQLIFSTLLQILAKVLHLLICTATKPIYWRWLILVRKYILVYLSHLYCCIKN